ncbi:MAG: TolC family protein [Gammaproteobacteria bacterium]|nr:TolC family protein [Gammaproteobacteria bacterium]MCH9763604.1 TolC family protein [Gammaproteobacteria bacterium]
MKLFFLMLLVILNAVITACTFAPKYLPTPPTNVPSKWHATDSALNTEACNTACIPWWQQFKDPALNDLIEKGLAYNNDIHMAVANIEAAQGELKRVQWDWAPNLDSLLGYTSFPYFGYPGVIAVLLPTYTMNIFKQIKEQKRAKYDVKITENMRDTVKLAVIAQISGSYFSYQAQTERLSILQTVARDLTEKLMISQQMYQDGLASNILVERAKSKLALIKAEEKVVKQKIVVSQNMLHFLLNENPAGFSFPRRFSQLKSKQVIIGALPLTVVKNRPDMMQAANELTAANAAIGAAVGNFFPTMQLSAARGDIATEPYGTKLGMPVYFNQALSMSTIMPLSNFGVWDKAKGVGKVAYYHYLDTFRKVLRDVDNGLSAHAYYTQRLDETVQSKNNLKSVYQLNNDLYQEGIISYFKLLDEKIKLDRMKVRVNQRKLDQLMTIVSLYQDLAVGYGCTH